VSGDAVLLRGGVVYSPADPFATAMVVADGRVGWVGSEGAADTAAGPGVRTVHLDGALVTPTFVDAHAHLTDTGLAMRGVDLSGARGAHDVLVAVEAAARAHPGSPVLGHGWDDSAWHDAAAADAGVPTRAQLDQAGDGAPVYLSRVDVHSALVSSALLDQVPAVTGLDGYADTGLLRRDAHAAARRASRDMLTPSQRRDLQAEALRAAAACGVGQVHEMAAPHIAGPDDLALLLEWTREAAVAQVVGYWGELDAVDTAQALGARGCAGDLCIDGSLGSRTAALHEPYDDDATTSGACYVSAEQAVAHVRACTQAGLQAGFHCIGDAAVDTAVAAVASVADELGLASVQAARHRLEHVEMISAPMIAEMARLGIVASVQPAFDAAWGGPSGMYAQRLGAARAATLNPLAAFARAGVTLAFGSDSPVTAFDPWGSVRAAATHRTPASAVTVRAAFAAHTRGGWRAAGVDDSGVLVPGAVASYAIWDVDADLVVQTPDERVAAWSTDPRSGVPGLPDLSLDAPRPRCRRTVVAGRTVFDADTDDTPGT
jgi:predicted amidohydrolase YtcJ